MPIDPAQLEWAWLGRVAFEPDHDFAGEEAVETAYRVEPHVNLGELVEQEDGSLGTVVTLSAIVRFTRPDDKEGPLPFSLDLDVHGAFRWAAGSRPSSEALAGGWLEYNAMYLLWPYLRAYVATLTGMTHLPPLTIYTMNVPQPPVLPKEDGDGEANAEAEAADSHGTAEAGAGPGAEPKA